MFRGVVPEKPRDLTEFVGPIRMSAEDVAALRVMARDNERTVSAEIRLAVRRYLEKEAA